MQLAFGLRRPTDPVGYSDYSAEFRFAFRGLPPAPTVLTIAQAEASLPWIDALRRAIDGLRPETAVILVMPPVYRSYLPEPGSLAAARMARCKRALAETGAGRPRGGFVDFRTDSADARDQGNFFDGLHYRNNLARGIEDRIIATLRPAATASQ